MDVDSSAEHVPAPVSVRNGPVDTDSPRLNGNAKRKSRSSITNVSYKDASDSDDGPLVCATNFSLAFFPSGHVDINLDM